MNLSILSIFARLYPIPVFACFLLICIPFLSWNWAVFNSWIGKAFESPRLFLAKCEILAYRWKMPAALLIIFMPFFWTLFGLDEPLLNKILDPIFPCQPNLILRFQSFHAKMHTNTELFMLKNAEKSLEWNIVLEKNGRFMITRIPM